MNGGGYLVLDWDAHDTIVGHVEDPGRRSLANRWTRGTVLPTAEVGDDLSVVVEVEPEGGYPDYFTLQQIPIVSSRFLEALRSAPLDNFQAFPVALVEPSRTITGHHILNIIGRVGCLDEKRAKVARVRSKVFRMRSLALDEGRTYGIDLFRLAELELISLVSTRTGERLQGLSGVRLAEAEGWSDSVWF